MKNSKLMRNIIAILIILVIVGLIGTAVIVVRNNIQNNDGETTKEQIVEDDLKETEISNEEKKELEDLTEKFTENINLIDIEYFKNELRYFKDDNVIMLEFALLEADDKDWNIEITDETFKGFGKFKYAISADKVRELIKKYFNISYSDFSGFNYYLPNIDAFFFGPRGGEGGIYIGEIYDIRNVDENYIVLAELYLHDGEEDEITVGQIKLYFQKIVEDGKSRFVYDKMINEIYYEYKEFLKAW